MLSLTSHALIPLGNLLRGDTIRRTLPVLLLLGIIAPPGLFAQAARGGGVPINRPALFFGYSYLAQNYVHTQLNPVSGGMNGWDAAYTVPFSNTGGLGFVVDASGHYQTSGFFTPGIYFVDAGPEYAIAIGRSRAFVHGSLGAMFSSGDVIAQTASHNVFLAGGGGGFDFRVSPRIEWRVQADWFHGGFSTNDTNQISQIVRNNVRIATGPVFRF